MEGRLPSRPLPIPGFDLFFIDTTHPGNSKSFWMVACRLIFRRILFDFYDLNHIKN